MGLLHILPSLCFSGENSFNGKAAEEERAIQAPDARVMHNPVGEGDYGTGGKR